MTLSALTSPIASAKLFLKRTESPQPNTAKGLPYKITAAAAMATAKVQVSHSWLVGSSHCIRLADLKQSAASQFITYARARLTLLRIGDTNNKFTAPLTVHSSQSQYDVRPFL
jgi:hypothetical protein